MLPSTGYFKMINCPFYDSGLCERPYCHFRHVKKDISEVQIPIIIGISKEEKGQDTFPNGHPSEESFKALVSEALKKVLRQQQETLDNTITRRYITESATLVSQVVEELNSVISRTDPATYSETPISRCQQKVYLPPAGIPQYKPTPIAELKKRHILAPYTPLAALNRDSKVQIKQSYQSKDVRKKVISDTNPHREKIAIHDYEISPSKKPTYSTSRIATTPSYGDLYGSTFSSFSVTNSINNNKFTVSHDGNDPSPVTFLSSVAENCVLQKSNTNVKPGYCPSENVSAGSSVEAYGNTENGHVVKACKENVNLETDQIVTESNVDINLELHEHAFDEIEDIDLTDEFNTLEKILSDNCNDSPKCEVEQEESKIEKEVEQCVGESLQDLELQETNDVISDAKVKDDSKNNFETKDSCLHTSACTQNTSTVSYKEKNKKETEKSQSIKPANKTYKDFKNNKETKNSNSKSKYRKSSSYETKRAKNMDKGIDGYCLSNGIIDSTHSNSSNDVDTSKQNDKPALSSLESQTQEMSLSVFGVNKNNLRETRNEKKSRNNSQKLSRGKSKELESKAKHNSDIPSKLATTKTEIEEELTRYLMSDSETDEETINEECYRIFQEYEHKPQPPPTKKLKLEKATKEEIVVAKKRIAHKGTPPQSTPIVPTKIVPNPIEIMHSRIAKLQELYKEEHENSRQQTLNNFPVSKSKNSTLSNCNFRSNSNSPGSTSTVSTFQNCTFPSASLPSSSYNSVPRRIRIAHVPNVSMLLNAKLRIQKIIQQRQNATVISTNNHSSQNCNCNCKSTNVPAEVRKTLQKGTERVAHKPSVATVHQPKLVGNVGGKIPANVRQKYLKLLISEYAKLDLINEEANTKAAKEEALIYEDSNTRSIYSSKISNRINFLRKQVKQRVEASSRDLQSFNQLLSTAQSSKVISHSSILTAPSRSNDGGSWSVVRHHKNSPRTIPSSFYKQMLSFMLTEELLCSNGFPREHPKEKGVAIVQVQQSVMKSPSTSPIQRKFIRNCTRCGCSYRINENGFQIKEEQCTYHWGKLCQKNIKGQWDHSYACCSGDFDSGGCMVGSFHVSDNFDPDNLRGFVKTLPMETNPPNDDYGVYALDCEMCYTTGGLELTRVTVIDRELDTVYESFVKPANPIIDYNTRFSGITENDMKNVKTTILDVQAALLSMFHEKTILIGHSLESDLKVLKLIHSAVVDTSVVFPHKMGPPKKRALKSLSREYLNKIIQESESGHDSTEDAKVCMELMKWKVNQCKS